MKLVQSNIRMVRNDWETYWKCKYQVFLLKVAKAGNFFDILKHRCNFLQTLQVQFALKGCLNQQDSSLIWSAVSVGLFNRTLQHKQFPETFIPFHTTQLEETSSSVCD